MSDRFDLGEEFTSGFVDEAEEHIRSANANLVAVDDAVRAGDPHPRAVRELFRSLHTIKGLASMVGVEPVVDVAHAMESVLRAADRAGGRLPREAIEPLIQGLKAIETRVKSVAARHDVAEAPPRLLEALRALRPVDAPDADGKGPAIALPDELLSRVTPAEREQLIEGVRAGRRAMRVDFVPHPERAERGISITAVRERLEKMGELVKVLPVSVERTDAAPGGLTFALLVVTDATSEELAEAADTTVESVVSLVPEIPPEEEEDLDALESGRRADGRGIVRVEVGRIDDAIHRLGELVISRSRLRRAVDVMSASDRDVRELRRVLDEDRHALRDLRSAIMRLRMIPVSDLLQPLQLVVRGLRSTTAKDVRIEIETGRSEIDKAVGERVFPAIVHLIRNAVDHGIERPEERTAAGKPAMGTIRVTCAERASAQLEIVVEDDGRGIDRVMVARRARAPLPEDDATLLELLCRPGLSTRDRAGRTSGRGMGMDIVKRIVVDQLGGDLSLTTTEHAGTRFQLRIPLTVTIVDAFSFVCAEQPFVAPVATVEEIVEIDGARVFRPPSPRGERRVELLERRGEAVPLVALDALLDIPRTAPAPSESGALRKALVVRRHGAPFAFGIDRMLGQQEVVVRPIDDPLVRVPGVSGATDLGDGRPTLVLDLFALTQTTVASFGKEARP